MSDPGSTVPADNDTAAPAWGDYEFLAPFAEELADTISDYYPTPDHVDAQTSPQVVAKSLLPIVHRSILANGAFDELERLRDEVRTFKAVAAGLGATVQGVVDALGIRRDAERDTVLAELGRRLVPAPAVAVPAETREGFDALTEARRYIAALVEERDTLRDQRAYAVQVVAEAQQEIESARVASQQIAEWRTAELAERDALRAQVAAVRAAWDRFGDDGGESMYAAMAAMEGTS